MVNKVASSRPAQRVSGRSTTSTGKMPVLLSSWSASRIVSGLVELFRGLLAARPAKRIRPRALAFATAGGPGRRFEWLEERRLLTAYVVNSTIDDGSAGTLRAAITSANSDTQADTITFSLASPYTINLTSMLPVIENSYGLTIDGNNGGNDVIINGPGADRIFFVGVSSGETAGSSLTATTSTPFTIENMTLENGKATGGNGGEGRRSGGGGGAGLGGAIFLDAGNLTLTNVNFSGNNATGGNGGISAGAGNSGGGGGGMYGAGANVGSTSYSGGGGGGIGSVASTAHGGSGAASSAGNTGTAGVFVGAASGGAGASGSYAGGANGGGGASSGGSGYGGSGGGVGGAVASSSTEYGGNGGFGGGGGGTGGGVSSSHGGTGGYGGGGGGGPESGGSISGGGGNGGFGGGGGGGYTGGTSAFGGGAGATTSTPGGGGGAGLGGAVFVRQGATINLTSGTFSSDTVNYGTDSTYGGGNGQAIGAAMFLAGGLTYSGSGTTTIGESLGSGATFSTSDGISGITGGLTVSGGGTLALTSATGNSYSGGTTIGTNAPGVGTLDVSNTSGSATGTGAVTVGYSGGGDNNNGDTLAATAAATISGAVSVEGSATISALSGSTLTLQDGLAMDADNNATSPVAAFSLGAPNGTSNPLINVTAGGITFGSGGKTSITVTNAGSLAAGSYDLIGYTGTAPGSSNFNTPTGPSGFTYAISLGTTGQVDLTVTVAAPAVTSSTANLANNAATLTINGSNFSATYANDSVAFSGPGASGISGSVTSATTTSLTYTFTTDPTSLGELDAVVTVTGVGSSGSPVQVATVVASTVAGLWNSGIDGTWNTSGNWTGGVPGNNAAGDTAAFNGTTGVTVDLAGFSPTLAGISFGGSAGNYTIENTGSGQLVIEQQRRRGRDRRRRRQPGHLGERAVGRQHGDYGGGFERAGHRRQLHRHGPAHGVDQRHADRQDGPARANDVEHRPRRPVHFRSLGLAGAGVAGRAGRDCGRPGGEHDGSCCQSGGEHGQRHDAGHGPRRGNPVAYRGARCGRLGLAVGGRRTEQPEPGRGRCGCGRVDVFELIAKRRIPR